MSPRLRLGSALPVVLLEALSSFARAEPPDERPAPKSDAAPAARAPAAPSTPAAEPLVTSRLARDCVSAAFRAAGYPETRRLLSSMAARARTSAILPDVWFRASRSTDESLHLSPTVGDPYRYSEIGGAGLWLEARLGWHLDRLVFDRDELGVERLRGDRSDAAAKLSSKVIETLFKWQRAALRAVDPSIGDDEREQAALSAAESAVILDVLTNGWFGERRRAGSAR
jgi:hypothetical protein